MEVLLTLDVDTEPLDVRWFCGEERIDIQSGRFALDGRFTLSSNEGVEALVISSVKLIDTAVYTCTIINEYGEVSTSADLLVLRKFSILDPRSMSVSDSVYRDAAKFLEVVINKQQCLWF